MLTDQQIQARKSSIGASDSAAVVGLNPYRTAWDVWASKTGRVDDFAGNEATEAGDLLEDAIIGWALKRLDVQSHIRAPAQIKAGIMSANIDAAAILFNGEPVIIEAKQSGVTGPLNFDLWGEDRSEDVPDWFRVQVQHQMHVAGPQYQRAFLAALLPPMGFVLYEIHRDEDAIAAIVEVCTRFWREHVEKDVPPDAMPTLEVAKRMLRLPGKEIRIDAALVGEWEMAKDLFKEAEATKDAAQAKLLAALGDAEIGIHDHGRLTYFKQTRKSYTVKESTFPVLRNKKG